MKKTIIALFLSLFLGALLAGCSGVADSGSDRGRRHKRIIDSNMRQSIDDWDYIMLLDRNSRLTDYNTRISR